VGPVSDGLLSIGAFSRASTLSVKMLRAYHEAGILVPARVDPQTGYRAYHAGQLTDAAVIRRLRSLDLPLAQVREVVEARDPDVTRRILTAHEEVMRTRLDEVTRIVADLQDGVEAPGLHTPVHVATQAAAHALVVRGRVTEDCFAAFLGAAYDELGAMCERLGIEPAGPAGALFPPEILDDNAEPVEAYLPLAAPVALPDGRERGGVVLGELPAVTVAVAVHVGEYETMSDTYRQLGAWVAQHATPADEKVREVYEVSFDQTPDTSRFRTEIQWPIVHQRT
jgi:DNA-binding transcriptional MerR regulator